MRIFKGGQAWLDHIAQRARNLARRDLVEEPVRATRRRPAEGRYGGISRLRLMLQVGMTFARGRRKELSHPLEIAARIDIDEDARVGHRNRIDASAALVERLTKSLGGRHAQKLLCQGPRHDEGVPASPAMRRPDRSRMRLPCSGNERRKRLHLNLWVIDGKDHDDGNIGVLCQKMREADAGARKHAVLRRRVEKHFHPGARCKIEELHVTGGQDRDDGLASTLPERTNRTFEQRFPADLQTGLWHAPHAFSFAACKNDGAEVGTKARSHVATLSRWYRTEMSSAVTATAISAAVLPPKSSPTGMRILSMIEGANPRASSL